jgi:hypothetical protein
MSVREEASSLSPPAFEAESACQPGWAAGFVGFSMYPYPSLDSLKDCEKIPFSSPIKNLYQPPIPTFSGREGGRGGLETYC